MPNTRRGHYNSPEMPKCVKLCDQVKDKAIANVNKQNGRNRFQSPKQKRIDADTTKTPRNDGKTSKQKEQQGSFSGREQFSQ